MIKKCLVCNKEFNTRPYLVKKGYGKYCSHKCYINAVKQGKYPKRGYQKGHPQLNTGKTHFKKGVNQGYGFKKGNVPWNKDKKYPQITGKNHFNWKGGVSDENEKIRHSLEMKCWEREVFSQNNRTCQKCKKKSKLTAHHILNFAEYPKLRFKVSNGITFCRKCHKLFHQTYGYNNNNKEQVWEFLR